MFGEKTQLTQLKTCRSLGCSLFLTKKYRFRNLQPVKNASFYHVVYNEQA